MIKTQNVEKENRKKRRAALKQGLLSALIAVSAVTLTACGGREETVSADETPAYVYVPEYIELSNDSYSNFYDVQITGDAVYYVRNTYDETAMTSLTEICRYTPGADTEPEALPVSVRENTSINGFTVDGAGNVYLCLYDYSGEELDADGFLISKTFLAQYDASGNLVYEQEITDLLNEDVDNNYVNGILSDDEGNLYLCSSYLVRLFDGQGNYQGEVSTGESWINSMGKGKDGKIYVSYYDNTSADGGMVIADIDFAAKKLGEAKENFPSGNGGNILSAGAEKDFLINDGTKLSEYDLSTQTSEEILDWLDSDINGQYVNSVGALSDGRIVAIVNDWNTGETEIALLTKTDSSKLVQKEQITIGTLYTNQNLQAAAVDFNKSSEQYRVDIKTYIDTNNWTETSYQDGITSLNNDITSGSNCPDILDLSQLNVEQLATKGVFEDLMPYLEESSVLDKDDFMENILESFQYDGALVAIPSTFSLSTVIGKTSDVGEEMGWTLDELIAYADAHEGAELFDGASKSSILYYCLTYNMDSFVDWSTGECKFDTPEFKSLLEFVNRFPDIYDWESDTRSQPAKIQAGDVLLAMAGIYDLNGIQEYAAMFGEPVTCIGYPTLDGSAGCILNVSDIYGIASKSDNKDGAWAFIEHYLAAQDEDNVFSWGLPTRQSKFDEMIAEATKAEYVLDENGEPMLDENGEPILAGGTSSISYGDWEYTYHVPTEEEIALLRELVSVAKPSPAGNDEINTIISEEAEAFYQGQKSVDDVAKVIQSRAQIYVSENS